MDQLKDSGPESGSSDPSGPGTNGSGRMGYFYIRRVRPIEANGLAVYTRNKWLKRRTLSRIGYLDKLKCNSEVLVKADIASSGDVISRDNSVNLSECESNLKSGEESEGEMVQIQVKLEPLEAPRNTMLKSKDEDLEMENGELGSLIDSVILESEELVIAKLAATSPKSVKMEMKYNKILVKGRPSTVRELFETGLLEGYPVFYNGGKKGFPLCGTIKDAGILCSCNLCRGVRVVRPCQFEIHACKSYRRASQYICLENGKSLLDVVKECQRSSFKTLQETIEDFIGPKPVKETVSCQNCKGSFLAISTAKVELLCDSCMIVPNSGVDGECVEVRTLEPASGLAVSENNELQTASQKKGRRGREKRKHPELTTYGRSLSHKFARKMGQRKIKKLWGLYNFLYIAGEITLL